MTARFLWVFFISLLPLVELRGAIPVSQAFTPPLPLFPAYVVAIVGNMVPVPFIYLFARRFLEWGARTKMLHSFCTFFLTKGKAAGDRLTATAGRGFFIALALFVAIPLPGTGAWTGTLGASFLGMRFKETVCAVITGVLIAGSIMAAVSAGVFSIIR
ncbi:MAG: small multi-drug export protein [Treponema sp.]|nr:small multi-drug export protein [Treponema sp.]